MTKADFDTQRANGNFGEPYEIDFFDRGNPEPHSHAFDALLLVTAGEFTLKLDTSDQTLGPGDLCTVAAGTRHAEICSVEGTTALVATRVLEG